MSGCSSHKRLISGACVKQAISHSPPFKGGEAAQRPGWFVKSRVASLYARVAILILFEITNHPVCAARERDLFLNGAATPPFKEGNGTVSQPPHSCTSHRVATRGTALITNQFSI